MEKFILDVLGPYATAWLLVPLVIVVVLRKVLRKHHILVLVATCVLSFIAFFVLLLWGVTWYDGTQSVAPFHAVLRLLAGLSVGCGAAVGYVFILKSLGLASLGGDGPLSSPRGR